jgi:hypothetical protein
MGRQNVPLEKLVRVYQTVRSQICSGLLSALGASRFSVFVPVNIVLNIATRYCLDGTGIKSHLGRNFPHPSRPALEPTQCPRAVVPPVTALITGGKAAGAWR